MMSLENVLYQYNRKPQIAFSYCLLVDVLGFSSRVMNCSTIEESRALCKRVIDILRKYRRLLDDQTLNEPDMRTHEYQMFSDTLVIGIPIMDVRDHGEPELGDALFFAAKYQLSLALEGFFVRGGLSFGELHMSNDLCFGKALVMANQLEAKAVVPRVLLSNEVIGLVHQHLNFYGDASQSPHNDDLLQDDDGMLFLNYLNAANYSDMGTDIKLLEKHAGNIRENLLKFASGDPIYEKYTWLRDYHNYFCHHFIFGSEECTPSPSRVADLFIEATNPAARFQRITEGNRGEPLTKSRF